MAIKQKTLETLEFDKVIAQLASLAFTPGAKLMAERLTPTDDYEAVVTRQKRTEDARRLLSHKGIPPFGKAVNVCDAAERAEKGAVLSMHELLDIADIFTSARLLGDYLNGNRLFSTVLDESFGRLLPNRTLEERIRRTVISDEMIADEASPELASIRRKMRAANNRIKETLQQYVSGQRSKYLQENLVTLRDGRYVVPVRAEYRNEIKGLLHDTSASGATLFIEPMAVVEANNELRELAAKEAREIDRILAELSALCAEFSVSLTQNYRLITDLAFVFSCAALAERMKAVSPILSKKPLVSLKGARHPLLDPKTAVPIDVALGEAFDTLVITGPNTGGKTVTLKTIGLFALMTQAGLQIPAREESEMGVFCEILADIGDEQSIEQSLSTFSAHIVTTVDILNQATDGALVLFDELGAGTDPVEGAALATAILEAVRSSGALVAATTHYAELKAYALQTPGVQNASCEFDVGTLRPTYRLIMGAPGKSNAFAISERLGVSSAIVARARALVSEENKQFETVIERLEADRIAMEKEKNEARRLREEYESFKVKAEEELKQRTKTAEDEIKKSLEKARQILDSTRATGDFVMKQLDDVRKKQDSARFAEELAAARRDIRAQLGKSDEMYSAFEYNEVNLEEEYVLPRPLKVGDHVYLVSFGQEGEVVTLPDKDGNLQVKAGILKAKTHVSKIRLLGKSPVKKEQKAKAVSKIKTAIADGFKPEIDVRGLTGDEAWWRIDKYIDDAYLAGVNSVRIIHGKGTGALRAALWGFFRADKRIASFRAGVYGEGDAGVSILELK